MYRQLHFQDVVGDLPWRYSVELAALLFGPPRQPTVADTVPSSTDLSPKAQSSHTDPHHAQFDSPQAHYILKASVLGSDNRHGDFLWAWADDENENSPDQYFRNVPSPAAVHHSSQIPISTIDPTHAMSYDDPGYQLDPTSGNEVSHAPILTHSSSAGSSGIAPVSRSSVVSVHSNLSPEHFDDENDSDDKYNGSDLNRVSTIESTYDRDNNNRDSSRNDQNDDTVSQGSYNNNNNNETNSERNNDNGRSSYNDNNDGEDDNNGDVDVDVEYSDADFDFDDDDDHTHHDDNTSDSPELDDHPLDDITEPGSDSLPLTGAGRGLVGVSPWSTTASSGVLPPSSPILPRRIVPEYVSFGARCLRDLGSSLGVREFVTPRIATHRGSGHTLHTLAMATAAALDAPAYFLDYSRGFLVALDSDAQLPPRLPENRPAETARIVAAIGGALRFVDNHAEALRAFVDKRGGAIQVMSDTHWLCTIPGANVIEVTLDQHSNMTCIDGSGNMH